MRLFVSYARVDQRFCTQIVETLNAHEVWYDQRLYGGDNWWDKIVSKINWAEGFVYLLSPESVKSPYCQREMNIAIEAGKVMLPILIQPRTEIPKRIQHIQYIDMSRGLVVETVKNLLDTLIILEREQMMPAQAGKASGISLGAGGGSIGSHGYPYQSGTMIEGEVQTLIQDAVLAYQQDEFDRAVYLLRQVKTHPTKQRFIDVDGMLKQAEEQLEKQAYWHDAQREYETIASLIQHSSTRKFGCHAFRSFREQFPNHDPQNLAMYCHTEILPTLKWCTVPSGEVRLRIGNRRIVFFISSFKISKYPITNAQYQLFVNAADGYRDPQWWQFSTHAANWHRTHPKVMPSVAERGAHPRAELSWYEAVAFCNWMSAKLNMTIKLPTEHQWQRASQGDDNRPYPWGETFDASLCNTRESGLDKTSPVMGYLPGISPYSVADLAGNVWEWCDNTRYNEQPSAEFSDGKRIIRGGSYAKPAKQAMTTCRRQLEPNKRNKTVGFRVVLEP